MVKATLMPYESFFHRFYEMERIESTIVYWDVESQAWRSFQLENLLDWSPSLLIINHLSFNSTKEMAMIVQGYCISL